MVNIISNPSLRFHTIMVTKISSILEPANRLLQSLGMDFQTVVQLMNTATECVKVLCTKKVVMELWSECAEQTEATDSCQTKRKHTVNRDLDDYVSADIRNTRKPGDHRATGAVLQLH